MLERRLAAVYFTYFVYVGAQGPYLGLYLAATGASPSQIGVLLGVMQLTRIVAPAAWTGIAERSGRPLFWVTAAFFASAVSLLGLLATRSFVGMFGVLAVHSFCAAGALPLVEAVTLGAVHRDVARYGLIRVWGSVSFTLAAALVGVQLDYWPIASLIPTMAIALAAAALAAMTLHVPPSGHGSGSRGFGALLADRDVGAILVACFTMAVAHAPLYAFFSIRLATLGYSGATTGFLWVIGVLVEIAFFWTQPRWVRRLGLQRAFAASFACAVLRFLLIGWLPESLGALVLAQALHGITFGVYHAAALGLLSERVGLEGQARAQALYTIVSFGAGGTVGAVASGAAWEALGPSWTFTAAALVVTVGGFFAHSLRGSRRH